MKGIGFEKFFSHYERVVRQRIMSDDFPPTLLDIKAGKNQNKRIPNMNLDKFTS